MPALLRVVSIVLLITMILAIAVSIILAGGDLDAIGPVAVPATLSVLFLFTIPVLSLFGWAGLRTRRLKRLAGAARRVAAGEWGLDPRAAAAGAEAEEIARAIDEMRFTMIEQRRRFEEQKGVAGEIFNGIGEGLLAIDRRKRIVLANRKVEELLGVSGLPLGRPFLEGIRNTSLISAFDMALAGEPSTSRTTLGVAGQVRQVEMRVFPLSTTSEVAAVALFIDVSRLEELERVRREFMADFSHEVRTPLAGIRSAIDTLGEGRVTDEQEEQLLRIIFRQVGRLERLVAEMGELKQIESGEVFFDRREVDLARVVRDVLDEHAEAAAASGIRLSMEGDAVTVPGDPTKLHQVFSNLVDNAIKHGGDGEKVRVELAGGPEVAIVRVIDQGVGIPDEERERIFHRFYRGDKSRSAAAGTGLGLAIVKHLILLHGGSIEVRSQLRHGTTFEVRLPR